MAVLPFHQITLLIGFLWIPSLLADPMAPRVVAVPPADAGRGLVRVTETEIRHYPGRGGESFLRSQDNGETWKEVPLPTTYPDATCMAKESPAIVRNPNTGEFLRVEPRYGHDDPSDGLYTTNGGLDGEWKLLTDERERGVKPGGILRSPLWVDDGRRIVLPAHGGGCWTWYSDDQGKSWKQSNQVQSPPHEAGGIHAGSRWNHGMVEGTIVELSDGRLWMLARTAQDYHYETFSKDFGETWSEPVPSRFPGTITMPTFHRIKDGRLLLLWSNTAPLPEVARGKKRGGEDVFTNRDALHAAISEDDGKSWIGCREVILDEHRNDTDYAMTPGSNDRGKHQSEVVQLDKNRVLLSSGQHPLHRKLIVLDLRWLYETSRQTDLAADGPRDWSTHQYIDKIVGHCGYNRTAGAKVEEGWLRVRRVKDPRLTNASQGATWNFPTAKLGTVKLEIRLDSPKAKAQICLTDRWFNPTDATVPKFADYTLELDANDLPPGKAHQIEVSWQVGQPAILSINGQMTERLPSTRATCPLGISYLHLYNPALVADPKGFSIRFVAFETN